MSISDIIKKSKSMSGIIRMINNNISILNEVISLTSYLDINVTVHERLFNIKNNLYQKSICPICKIESLEWNNKYKKYKHTCISRKCKNEFLLINKDPEIETNRRKKISDTQKSRSVDEKKLIIEKIKKTNISKYGVDSYAKTKEFKDYMLESKGYISPFELSETHDKSKKTLMERYGCDHNFKIDNVKKNKKKTFLEKYGVDNPTKSEVIKKKIKCTNNIKYGGNSPMNNIDIKKKAYSSYKENYIMNDDNMKDLVQRRESTMLEKYGYKYWIQDSNNIDKIVKKTTYKKVYINNKLYYLQGYEDYVLFEILLKKYCIDDIYIYNKDIESCIGKIFYDYKNKTHKYYPDFFIKSENKIYEVKSEYTYIYDMEKNKLKENACINKSINFEFIIIDKQKYRDWIKIIK